MQRVSAVAANASRNSRDRAGKRKRAAGNKNSSAEQSQACRDYLNGICERGNKCRYVHDKKMAPDTNKVDSGDVYCRDFQVGRCNRKTCKFPHFYKDSNSAVNSRDNKKNNDSFNYSNQGFLNNDNSVPFHHNQGYEANSRLPDFSNGYGMNNTHPEYSNVYGMNNTHPEYSNGYGMNNTHPEFSNGYGMNSSLPDVAYGMNNNIVDLNQRYGLKNNHPDPNQGYEIKNNHPDSNQGYGIKNNHPDPNQGYGIKNNLPGLNQGYGFDERNLSFQQSHSYNPTTPIPPFPVPPQINDPFNKIPAFPPPAAYPGPPIPGSLTAPNFSADNKSYNQPPSLPPTSNTGVLQKPILPQSGNTPNISTSNSNIVKNESDQIKYPSSNQSMQQNPSQSEKTNNYTPANTSAANLPYYAEKLRANELNNTDNLASNSLGLLGTQPKITNPTSDDSKIVEYKTMANPSDPRCTSFDNGYCYRGEKCKFKHVFESNKVYNNLMNNQPIVSYNIPPIDNYNKPPIDNYNEAPIDNYNKAPIDNYNKVQIDGDSDLIGAKNVVNTDIDFEHIRNMDNSINSKYNDSYETNNYANDQDRLYTDYYDRYYNRHYSDYGNRDEYRSDYYLNESRLPDQISSHQSYRDPYYPSSSHPDKETRYYDTYMSTKPSSRYLNDFQDYEYRSHSKYDDYKKYQHDDVYHTNLLSELRSLQEDNKRLRKQLINLRNKLDDANKLLAKKSEHKVKNNAVINNDIPSLKKHVTRDPKVDSVTKTGDKSITSETNFASTLGNDLNKEKDSNLQKEDGDNGVNYEGNVNNHTNSADKSIDDLKIINHGKTLDSKTENNVEDGNNSEYDFNEQPLFSIQEDLIKDQKDGEESL